MDARAWRPRIGDRVRVRDGVGHETPCSELQHYFEEHGRAGRIIRDQPRPGAPSHRFLIAFDPPLPVTHVDPVGPVSLPVRHYTIDELELAND